MEIGCEADGEPPDQSSYGHKKTWRTVMATLQPSALRQLYLGVPVEAERLHQNPDWKARNLLSPSLYLMAT